MNKAVAKIYAANELLYSTGTGEHVGELAPPVEDRVREAMGILQRALEQQETIVGSIKRE